MRVSHWTIVFNAISFNHFESLKARTPSTSQSTNFIKARIHTDGTEMNQKHEMVHTGHSHLCKAIN